MNRRLVFWVFLLVVVALISGGLAAWHSSASNQATARATAGPFEDANASRKASAPSTRPVARDRSEELRSILTGSDPAARSEEFGRVLREWFQRDPEAALAFLRTVPRGAEYTNGLLIVLGGIAEGEPERALDLAREMVTSPGDWIFYNALFARLAQKDPVQASAMLDRVPEGEPKANALRALLSGWTTNDSAAAWSWAMALSNEGERAVAMETVLVALSSGEPAKVIGLAEIWLSGETRDRVVAQALRRLIELDPMAARGAVDRLPVGAVRSEAMLGLIRALATQDADAALSWINTIGDESLRASALRNLLDVWSLDSPEQARAHVFAMPPGRLQDAAAAQLATGLAATDPVAGYTWVDTLASDSARNSAYLAIASAWARSNPEAATRWTASFPESQAVRVEAIHGALSYWGLVDPAAASAFALSLPETEQPAALLGVIPLWAQRDVGAALAWAEGLDNADLRDIVLDSLVNRWADNRPQDAAAWVIAQPESPARVDEARTVAGHWLRTDTDQAIAWVTALPVGPTRDGAMDAVAEHYTGNDPAAARMFAQKIQSAPLREARLERIAATEAR